MTDGGRPRLLARTVDQVWYLATIFRIARYVKRMRYASLGPLIVDHNASAYFAYMRFVSLGHWDGCWLGYEG